ncbi:glutamate synthase [Pseudomonas sp. MPR-R2A7]|nr:glutamate synthase [Pseudomonas sp. GW460-12]PMX34136.1 glutamate synthase [Pseudomonas sp. MPR-R2A4]PMX41016.1 glutamate synthase [Pseudomonas sp. MPR-R2A7]PMX53611.1 glutamate synthase [Pseudomonas sp. MPR-R2A6]PMX90581.1 glutamate synthase [Pseudomonas sp. MPR-R2A3]PMY12978.1 glutamate synthase [Pseudomonas sp. MPR-R2A5]PNA34310.1 glutamate synthase [Pseudomonas sp. MPR-ANB1]PNA47583.1 glutamate synthase [Pseudomonas sp. MPR-LB5]PNA75455.1 glutamate synthase [Pseudomonas sp. MPR-LB3]
MSPGVDLTKRQVTGAVRISHPIYHDLLPPCNDACPAGENVQAWLALAQAGDYQAAWQSLIADNPFPAIHGRVCYHPCETSCNRNELDSSVSIHAVERFLGDLALEHGWTAKAAPPSGKRMLIVGAGPCGLSAAWHLAMRGHAVEIHEAGPVAGGMLHFGIPAYRLPRDVLHQEIARLETLDIRILLNRKVEDVLLEQANGRFDAVLLSIGAQVGRHIDIPARDAAKVYDAVNLLHAAGTGEKPLLGRRVVVYGGGNTAIDAARTARRLGAEDAMIIYHRDRAHMSALPFETEEALEEGIKIRWLSSIKGIDGQSIEVEKMSLDADGKARPTGEFETLPADALILALGQTSDTDFLRSVPDLVFAADGTLIVGPDMQTGHAGLFAGGDVTPGNRTVTTATGHGKHAARHIDAWFNGQTWAAPERHRLVHFEDLHLPIYTDALPSQQKSLGLDDRVDFAEVVGGLSATQAQHEARRCLSCGNCYECDNCFAACPEDAIIKLGPQAGYEVNMSLCTGCAVCFDQCPCHAIDMAADAAAVVESPQ